MGTEILASLVFGGAVWYFSAHRPRQRGMEPNPFAVSAAFLFAGAFLLRLWLGYTSEGFSTDIDTFKSWGSLANDVGFSQVYRQDVFLDYPPGYLYVLSFLDHIRRWASLPYSSSVYTLLMKLPSLLSDLLCAGALLWLGKRKLGEREALFLSAAYLFCPAVLINSAQWGQVDSITAALLLFSAAFLYQEQYLFSALLYGLGVACKPQMLIFAPLYLFFALKQRKYGKLLLGVACALGAILLTALPFTQNFDFLWLLEKYKSTLDYYCYYSVNACNFWALIGWNWKTLPQGISLHLLNLGAPVLATLLCGAFLYFSKRKDALFACPVLLMAVMYLLGVKMHERYLYPAFLFLLLCFLWSPDKRLIRAFALSSGANYLNVAYVLHLFRETGGSYDPNNPTFRLLSGAQVLALGYLLYILWAVYLKGQVLEGKPRERRLWKTPGWPEARITQRDIIAVAVVTLLYGAVAFWRLGSLETAVTPWAPALDEAVVLQAESPCDAIFYLPGLAPDDEHRAARTGVNLLVETSEDGKVWTECGNLSEGGTYVFAWTKFRLPEPASYVRLTPLDGSVVINEAALKLRDVNRFAALTVSEAGKALVDEQEKVPFFTTYENSTYFDEIYHARTAYENILGLEPYENTHPPLGKYIISLGIRLFGMCPFGWRFMGTLFGVLMLPVLYHLLKQLFGKTSICAAGTLWFAFDFMHFTQTRIATIDTYAVFFLLLMYDAMVVFLRRDLLEDSYQKLLAPLCACGIFTGLGIASKWTAAYGALGLAVLFFGKLFFAFREHRQAREEVVLLQGKSLLLCLWCCFFFLVIPFGLYFGAYLPLTTLPHNISNVWGSFWSYQTNMFHYHAGLQAEHFFASPWYEWPFNIRPIWYFSQDGINALGQYSTISALGNPLLWWAGVPALIAAGVLWARGRKAYGAVALCGFLSVYLPWTLVPRLTFIYHYFTAVPFLVIALAGIFAQLPESRLGSRRIGNEACSVSFASVFLWVFTAAVLALFCLYFPVISGAPTSKTYADALELFGTWYF